MIRGSYMAPDSLEEAFEPLTRHVRFQLPDSPPTTPKISETSKSEKRKIEIDKEFRNTKKMNNKFESWEEQLQKQKYIAELENIKLLNYKLRLDILEKERQLGLHPSEFTKDLTVNLCQDEL